MKMLDSGSYKLNLKHALQVSGVRRENPYFGDGEMIYYTIIFLSGFEKTFYFKNDVEANTHRNEVIELIEAEK